MIARREKVRVGLFVILCAVIAVGLALALAGITTTPTAEYGIVFEESVSGLDEASPVKLLGKKIGKVKAIGIDPERELPRVTIAIDPKVKLHPDTIATIGYVSYASGTRYIELAGGSPDSPVLAPGSTVRSKPSAFTDLTAITGKVTEALDNLARLVDEDTKRAVRSLLTNADRAIGTTSERLADSQARLDESLAALRSALEEAEGLLRENRPAVKQTVAALEEGVRALSALAADAKKREVGRRTGEALDALARAADSIARTSSSLERLLARNEGAIDEIVENLRATSRDFAEVAREVKERPTLLLREVDRGQRSGRD